MANLDPLPDRPDRPDRRVALTQPSRVGPGSLLDEPAIHVAGGCVAMVGALLAAAAWHVGDLATLVLLAAVVALAARSLPLRWRLATAAAAWGLLTGFAVNDFGELSFAPGDLVRMAALTTSAVLAGGPARTTR